MFTQFRESWKFTRGLTLDLLNSLDRAALVYTPSPHVGEFWHQFRHLARVQDNYLDGLENRSVKFGVESANYAGGADKAALLNYLNACDKRLDSILSSLKGTESIDFYGETIAVDEHLNRLIAHETLHHGQCIMFMRMGEFQFPSSWSIWGV